DDLLTLVLEVGGQGYLGSISQPKLPKLDGWKDVGTQSKTEAAGKSKSFGGKKIFEVLLRPEKTGTLTIPQITYATYDTEQKKYVEQTAGPFQVQVAKGKGRPLLIAGSTATPAPATAAKSEANAPQFFGEQLAYIHPDLPTFAAAPTPLYRRDWYIPICLLSLAWVALAGLWRFWRNYTATHATDLKERSAGGKARKELREAGSALHAKKLDEFYLKLGEAVRGYLGVKLNRSASGLTLDEIARTLGERGVDAETATSTRDLLETCDQARYMPGAQTEDSARELLNRAESLLKMLDKKIIAGGKAK
ncbi:TPA: hypothetical protein DDW35_02250, partial [Candidatus Sumerlaeota bacterium]|nr:hypothetical protein [Candidatus Sumerlaeota bacterium]